MFFFSWPCSSSWEAALTKRHHLLHSPDLFAYLHLFSQCQYCVFQFKHFSLPSLQLQIGLQEINYSFLSFHSVGQNSHALPLSSSCFSYDPSSFSCYYFRVHVSFTVQHTILAAQYTTLNSSESRPQQGPVKQHQCFLVSLGNTPLKRNCKHCFFFVFFSFTNTSHTVYDPEFYPVSVSPSAHPITTQFILYDTQILLFITNHSW